MRKKGFVIESHALTRGALLEIEVELESEFIFQFSSVVQALAGMARKNPAMFGQDEEEISEFSSISSIIEELLVGLIPLRGRAVDYSVVVFDPPDDGKLIVHNRLLENLENNNGFTTRPLFVVGVTEQALFWKDIRRVLFAGQRFRVLCRVARDDIGGSWVPLKLQEVVSSVFPELGEEIEKINRGDLFKAELDGTGGVDIDRESVVRSALQLHASQLAELNEVHLSDDVVDSIDAIASEYQSVFETAQEKRESFRVIENHMVARYGISMDTDADREAAKDSRRQADEKASASQATEPRVGPGANIRPPGNPEDPDDEYFLDSEFVAIYW